MIRKNKHEIEIKNQDYVLPPYIQNFRFASHFCQTIISSALMNFCRISIACRNCTCAGSNLSLELGMFFLFHLSFFSSDVMLLSVVPDWFQNPTSSSDEWRGRAQEKEKKLNITSIFLCKKYF